MPKVLTRLRIDEISAVDKAAGEGTRIMLYKRATEERDGFYHRLFAKGGSGRVVRPPRRLRGSDQLRDIADAKNALLFSPDGRSLLRDTGADIDELASHLLEASGAVTNKRGKDTDMNNMELIVQSDVGMHAFCKGIVDRGIAYPHSEFDSKVLEPYARNKFPTLHPGNAIAKVLAEEPPVAAAYSAVHSAYYPAYAVAKAAVADDEADDTDALEKLQALGAEVRRRNPSLTREQAFAKAYTDPENAALVKRERSQHRPR